MWYWRVLPRTIWRRGKAASARVIMKGLTFTRMKPRTSDQTQDILVHETTAPAKGTLRVLLIAPSFDIVGGHSVQANRLLAFFRKIPWLEVKFQPINARLPRPLESIRFLRTILRSLIYAPTVLARTLRADVLHVFTASFYSYNLWTLPALACAKLCRRKIVL